MDNPITGKRILITGAGGSIGSELTRQCNAMKPAAMMLLDSCEYNIYRLEQAGLYGELADVRDLVHLKKIDFDPDLVFHAAAIKHVPLAERNIEETVLVNVAGTLNVREAFPRARMVLISTDKAVNPINVMGATKRLAELVADTIVVRFGNVAGSSGSVMPLFEEQIARGGPVTITHPNVMRYFMTIQQACALVIKACVNDGIHVLDMGEPIRILDLAREMIDGRDIPIKYIGLRPGEKITEELHYEDETRECVTPAAVEALFYACWNRTGDALRLLKKLLPEFKHYAMDTTSVSANRA